MGYYVSAEALAAAKSVEGRQQGDDITRRCSAGVGHRTGVIERPKEPATVVAMLLERRVIITLFSVES
eukprot:4808976-Prorocentrum_lima.AAC.1